MQNPPSAPSFLCPRCRASQPTSGPCANDGAQVLRNRTDLVLAQRYRFRRPIGRGAMGVVWEAEQLTLARRVAVKLLPHLDEETTSRFRRGAVVMAKMSHPNIVAVYDFGDSDGPDGREQYLVMERLSGVGLNRFMLAESLPFGQAVSAVAQALLALDHVHRRGFIHRDVKPANLFVTAVDDDPFIVKLLDFGIARIADGPLSPERIVADERERAMRVTQPMRILGTPEYMAPEQILGLPLDLRVDLYAVGAVFFHLVIGRLPYHGERYELYQAHLREQVPAIGQWLSGPTSAIDAWQDFFCKSLAKSPEHRFDSALSMRAALLSLPTVTVHEPRR